uniref:hypothetical protein n=1 Tax=uncultured Bacteroides sp. TaxID=162156 RepID=UPI002594F1AC
KYFLICSFKKKKKKSAAKVEVFLIFTAQTDIFVQYPYFYGKAKIQYVCLELLWCPNAEILINEILPHYRASYN